MEDQSSAIQGALVQNILASLPLVIAGVRSDEIELQLTATIQFRELLRVRNPQIEVVIQSGVVPKFVEFLTREDYPKLQLEAAWVITNIASGTSDNVRVVIDSGAVPILIRLFGSPSYDVREMALWAIGNIAGDSPKSRDLVLAQGALIPLLEQLNEHAELSTLSCAVWTLSNFCRVKPYPPLEQMRHALPALKRLINHSTDEEVLTNVCSALACISHGAIDKIQAVIEANICPRLVELLMHPSPSVVIPALGAVGNICSGNHMQTQIIINHQLLPCLLNLLTNNHEESIKRDACLAISNITAGNKDQIQAVIAAEIIDPLMHLLQTAELDIQKEAAWAISNATDGTDEQIKYLVGQGCIRPLCDLLVCPDPIIVRVCLNGLENILRVGEAEKNLGTGGGVNVYAQLIDEAEGLEKIKNLKSHDNTETNEKAMKILETYWRVDADEPLPPGDAAAAASSSEERELVSRLKRRTPEKPSENTNGMETQAEGERAQLEQPETGVTVGPSGFLLPVLKKLKTLFPVWKKLKT